MTIKSDPAVDLKFESYPPEVKERMLALREMIMEVARDIDSIHTIEETLKWGEPSYLTKHGSTLRIDWKSKHPNQCALYFNCKTQLIPTFRIVYPDLMYKANRALILQITDYIPKAELRSCIQACLTYHKIKHLPLLGL